MELALAGDVFPKKERSDEIETAWSSESATRTRTRVRGGVGGSFEPE
jgi:hypothetical protein